MKALSSFCSLVLLLAAGGHTPVAAQPAASDIFAAVNLSADDQARVLGGEFVSSDLTAVSSRDLSVLILFVVQTSPDDLARKVMAGTLSSADEQMTARGNISREGSVADFADLHLTPGGADFANTLIGLSGGNSFNFSTAELAALNGLNGQGDPVTSVEQQLRTMLLARYRSYRQGGLSGIPGYDRGGKIEDPTGDLRGASAAPLLKQYYPSVQKVLTGYPRATVDGLTESFFWVNNHIDDQPTFALTHMMMAPEGNLRILIQRQFYVSRSYNVEQAIAGFIPIAQGTLVVYSNHTFTDQVSGFGGSAKQSIGRRVMAGKLKELFEAERAAATGQ